MSTAYEDWIGREEVRTDRIHASVVQAMAATLDCAVLPEIGHELPPGWHWLFFNPSVRRSELGVDGHPKRGGFLPPIELPRRMWAGSRLRYLSGLPIGAQATRHSRIIRVVGKMGKRGQLWFVTVRHTTSCENEPCIVEEQDIVYRGASPSAASASRPEPYGEQARWGHDVTPDTTLLFRYSALTFNGHRIHYDRAYAIDEEGYPDLVVHGPLTATYLQQLALERGNGRPLSTFDFRGVSPLFVNRRFRVEGREEPNGSLILWARGPDGELAVSATASFK